MLKLSAIARQDSHKSIFNLAFVKADVVFFSLIATSKLIQGGTCKTKIVRFSMNTWNKTVDIAGKKKEKPRDLPA